MTSGLTLNKPTLTTALGRGNAAQWQALKSETSGLIQKNFENQGPNTWLGYVDLADVELPPGLTKFDCRNNRLAELGLRQDNFVEHVENAKNTYGPSRIGVFIGTSTSGLQQTELAYAQLHDDQFPDWYSYVHTQNPFSICGYLQQRLALTGHAVAVSTACSSSAKAFAVATRAIRHGICDAAIVGGVDSLCLNTLWGFNALQVLSKNRCTPMAHNRNGISIGEAAGFVLLEPKVEDDSVYLLGVGESSDAHHMSAPEPSGRGAKAAMTQAVSGYELDSVDYINLHGTATPANDAVEDLAVADLFAHRPLVSSTKGWTGHALGAASIVELIFSMLVLEHQVIPRTLNCDTLDPSFRANHCLQQTSQKVRRVLSNSYGFGGNNCSLFVGAK